MAPAAKVLEFVGTGALTWGPDSNVMAIGEDVTASASSESDPAPTRRMSRLSGGYPRIVPVQNLASSVLRLAVPIHVVIEESDGYVVAMSYDLDLAEQGDTEFEALAHLREAIVELYSAILELGVDAPPHLAEKLAFLQAVSIPCR